MDMINLFHSFDSFLFPFMNTRTPPHSGSGRLGVGFGGGFMREAIMAHPNRVHKSKQQNFLKVKS